MNEIFCLMTSDNKGGKKIAKLKHMIFIDK